MFNVATDLQYADTSTHVRCIRCSLLKYVLHCYRCIYKYYLNICCFVKIKDRNKCQQFTLKNINKKSETYTPIAINYD